MSILTSNITSDDDKTISLFNKLKQGTFGLLYTISKFADENSYVCHVYFIIEFLQILSFFFPLDYNLTHYMKELFGWKEYIDWLGYFASCFRIYPYSLSNHSLSLLLFSVGLFIFLLFAIASISIILLYSSTSMKNLYMIYYIRKIVEVVYGPAYIPFLSFMAQYLVCSDHDNAILGVCGSSARIIMFTLSIIITIAYVGSGIVVASCFYSRDPTSRSLLARPHSRVQTFQTIANSSYVISFILAQSSENHVWLLALLLFLGNGTVAYLYYQKLPYFYWDFNRLQFCLYSIQVWAAICLGVNIIFPLHSNAVSILFLIIIPLVVVFSYLMIDNRRLELEECPFLALSDEFDVEIKTRLMIEDVTTYMRMRNKEYGRYLNINATKFDLGYTYEPLPSFPRTADEHESIRLSHEKALEEAELTYIAGMRRFPVSMMAIFRAQYSFCYKKEISSALHNLSKAEQYNPIFDEFYSIFSLRLTYAELDEENQKDIFAYLSWQHNQSIAKKEDEKATSYQLRFWTELSNSHPDMARLHELSLLIHHSMQSAQDAYKKLLRLNGQSEKILRQYSSFLIDVLNRVDEAQLLVKRADELEEAAVKQQREGGASSEGLLGDRVAIISVSSDFEHLGEINELNTGVVRVLGYSRSDLINTNVSRIIPNPYSMHHNDYLKRYQTTGSSKMMNTNNFVIALHKNGYLLPVEFYLREISGAQLEEASGTSLDHAESNYIAVIKTASFNNVAIGKLGPIARDSFSRINHTDKVDFCMVDASFNITYITTGIYGMFGVTLDSIRRGVRISTLINDFQIRIEELMKAPEDGLEVSISCPENKVVNVNCIVQMIPVIGNEYYYLVQIISQPAVYQQLENKMEVGFSSFNADKSFIEMVVDSSISALGYDNQSELQLDNKSQQATFFDFSSFTDPLPEVKAPEKKSFSLGSPSTFSRKKSDASTLLKPLEVDEINMTEIELTTPNISLRNLKLAEDTLSESKSHGSHGSHGSASSARSMHQTLRSFTLSNQNQGLGRGLKNLMYYMIISFSVVCVMALVKYLVLSSMFDTYNTNLQDTYNGARMKFLASRIACVVNLLTLCPSGTFGGFYTLSDCNYQQNTILPADIAELQALNTRAIVDRGSNLAADHYSFYINPSVVVTSQASGSLAISYSTLSLWNAVKTFVDNAKIVQALLLDDVIDFHPSVFFVIQNGIGNIYTALNISTFKYSATGTDYVGKIFAAMITIVIFICVSVFLLIFFVIKSQVWLVEDNKNEVLVLFTEIPMVMIESFLKRCEIRLYRIQREKEQYQKEGIEDEPNLNEDEALNIDELLLKETQIQNEDQIIADEEQVADKPKKKSNKQIKRREITATDTSFFKFQTRHLTLLKISSILVACVIYFTMTYWFEFGSHYQFFLYQTYNLAWSQYRQNQYYYVIALMRLLMSQDYKPPGTGGSPNIMRVSPINVTNGINFFLDIENSLAFGDSTRNLVKPNGDQAKLLFTSASCTAAPGIYYPLPECSTYNFGIMADGIHGATLGIGSLMKNGLNDILNSNLSDFTSINSTFHGDFAILSFLQENDYKAVSVYARELSLSSGIKEFNSLFTIRISLFISFVIWSFLIFIFYFRPLIWELNAEQKRTITFLLLIPASVMEKMKSLRNFVQKMAADDIENNME